MDAIHPILPQPPNIPPVVPPPSIGRIDRDERRKKGEQDEDGQDAQRRAWGRDEGSSPDGQDESAPHIDLTA
jgi:hypothetical protein